MLIVLSSFRSGDADFRLMLALVLNLVLVLVLVLVLGNGSLPWDRISRAGLPGGNGLANVSITRTSTASLSTSTSRNMSTRTISWKSDGS